MNGSNPFPLLGLAANGLTSAPVQAAGAIAQAPDGTDGSFGDSLSAALSGAFAVPVAPPADQPINGIGLNAAVLADGRAIGQEMSLLGDGAPAPIVPSQLQGGLPEGEGHSTKPLASALNRMEGQLAHGALVSPESHLPEAGVKAGSPQTEQRLHQAGSRAAMLASLSQLDEQSRQMMMQGGRHVPSAMVSAVNGPSRAQQLSMMASGEARIPTMAASASAMPVSADAKHGRDLPQPRLVPSHGNGQPLIGDTGSGGPTNGLPIEPLKSGGTIGIKLSTRQSARASELQPTFADQAREQIAADGANLAPVKGGGQAANVQAVIGGGTSAAKPDALASAPKANAVDAIENGARSSGSAELFGFDAQSLDQAGATSSKPSASAAQPPSAQIAMHIARAIPQGIDRFSIQLHPADLGMVEIRLDFAEEGRVSALITAERPETLEILQRDGRSIERTLNNAGLSLENNGLSFSLKQEQHQQGQGFNSASHQQQSRAYHGGTGRNDGAENPLDQKLIAVDRQRLLDIRT